MSVRIEGKLHNLPDTYPVHVIPLWLIEKDGIFHLAQGELPSELDSLKVKHWAELASSNPATPSTQELLIDGERYTLVWDTNLHKSYGGTLLHQHNGKPLRFLLSWLKLDFQTRE